MKKAKKVLLIGGRSKARSLALTLLEEGYQVTAININYNDCMSLSEIKGLTVIHGDGTKPFILDEADASSCDIAIALTNKDSDNLVACQLCKKQYGIEKTVSLVSVSNNTDFFYKMGVDGVVCSVSTVTNIIKQQAFIDEMTNVIPIGKGKVQIIEVQITEESPVTDKKLWEISLPQQAIVGCIIRGDMTLIPRGDTRIFSGDTLVVLVDNSQQDAAAKVLTGRG